MRVPRVTIAGMMAAVAVVAFDCFAVMMTDLLGVVLIVIALDVGFIRWWRVRGPRRRFWAGFEAAGLAALLAYIACVRATGAAILGLPILVLGLLESVPIGAVRSAVYHLETSNRAGFHARAARDGPGPADAARRLGGWLARGEGRA